MKNSLKTVLKTAVIAAALAYAGASQAAYTATVLSTGSASVGSGKSFDVTAGNVGIYEYSVVEGASQYAAFCIDPWTDIASVGYTAETLNPLKFDARIQRLYETSYASLSVGTTNEQRTAKTAFQLALWELAKDDADLYAVGHDQYFALTNTKAQAADVMLQKALDSNIALTGAYQYVQFTAVGGRDASQTLLGVSAVPEADTWAMMGVGLGLVGLMGRRRKSAQTEKFA